MHTCASCGRDNQVDARFCSGCGAALAATAPPREVRKTVTVLFRDLTGSTALGKQTDPEATVLERAIDDAREALKQALQVWERKRCLPLAGRARERIDSLRQAQV